MQYAPIIIFAFNRVEALRSCVASLHENKESRESDLFVFVDGPRSRIKGEDEKVQAVREFAKTITHFKSITLRFSESNKGLANSIIGGVTEVLNKYDRVIVLEDDLYVAPSFLSFLNMMLEHYQNDGRIMQITGYSSIIRKNKWKERDFYLSGRAHSWSWGTWKDRWDTVDWTVADFDELAKDKARQKAFCKYGSDLYGMLEGWHSGRNNSWYIRFDYAMHKQGKYSIAPIRSLVRNDGFGPGATHTTVYNRYKIDFNTENYSNWRVPEKLEFDEELAKYAVRYWSIPYRVYGKIVTKMINCLRNLDRKTNGN